VDLGIWYQELVGGRGICSQGLDLVLRFGGNDLSWDFLILVIVVIKPEIKFDVNLLGH